MEQIEQIFNDIKDHACQCADLNFSMKYNYHCLSKSVYCKCGKEWEVPFSIVRESKKSEETYARLQDGLEFLNHSKFRKNRYEILKKEKEENRQRKSLERRKNAIGSLEV